MLNLDKVIIVIENRTHIFNSLGYNVTNDDILNYLQDVLWRDKKDRYVFEMVNDIHNIDVQKVIEYKNTKEMIESSKMSFDDFSDLFNEEVEPC